MRRSITRRTVLRYLIGAFTLAAGARFAAFADESGAPSNFRSIYSNPELRQRFYPFLVNVFHLYPEDRLHDLLIELSARYSTDREIYEALAARLPDITPHLSTVTYALPALRKQKREMAAETADLLGERRAIDGYVEIGTTGRYFNTLRRHLGVSGPRYVVNDEQPIYSAEDIFERGQVRKIGTYVAMGNYEAFDRGQIPQASIGLCTNYIGFHHAPADKLDGFVVAIARMLRPGGTLVVRDHDADGPEMKFMVGLAHDVFNAGVGIPWDRNEGQIRNFRSIRDLTSYLEARGFRRQQTVRFQDGDPTRNGLMAFRRTGAHVA
jgi:SAM-dependent methyltransferase